MSCDSPINFRRSGVFCFQFLRIGGVGGLEGHTRNNLLKKMMVRVERNPFSLFLAKELAPMIFILKYPRVFRPRCPSEGLSATGARRLLEAEE